MFRTDVGKHFLTNEVSENCYNLPVDVINAKTMDSFRKRLDDYFQPVDNK